LHQCHPRPLRYHARSVVSLEIAENGKTTRLTYASDMGRPVSYILKPPQPFPQCEYLITESTYGNRLHPLMQDAEAELLRVIRQTCVEKGGKVIIPAFAMGRTQEVVYAPNNFFNEGLLSKINIYVDSPLAVDATRYLPAAPR
jgi:metallo-beta-lactamase family protein